MLTSRDTNDDDDDDDDDDKHVIKSVWMISDLSTKLNMVKWEKCWNLSPGRVSVHKF